MSLSTDPITVAAQGIWTALESHEPLASLVRIGNRVKLDDQNENPLNKVNVSTTDVPELRLEPQSWAPTDHQGRVATSNSRFITITFGLNLYTDKWRTGDESGVYPIIWHSTVALWRLVNVLPGSPDVRYAWPEGGQFVIGQRGGVNNEGQQVADGIRGWGCVAQIRATLVLNSQSLGINT